MAATIQFGALTTTAVTANQAILTNTPVNTLSLKCIVISAFLTTYSATEVNMGTVRLLVGGVQKGEWRFQNTDNDTLAGTMVIPLGNGLTFSGAEAVLVDVTPASTTSMRWAASYFFN